MKPSARLFLMILLGLLVVFTVGPAWADDKSKAPATAVAPEQSSATPSKTSTAKVRNTPDSFERTARLESMRYRHLWLAYGFIWLIVFLFVFRTWKLNQSNSVELDALTRRLKALESDEPPTAPQTETTVTVTTAVTTTVPSAGGTDGDA